jgi:cAMP phosphodiesterase
MIVRVLGCSGGVGKGLRTTSYLLDEHILLDGGTGVGDLTLDEMRQIRHLVLTHAHLDHIAGFALMLSSIYDSFQHTIQVHGPQAVIDALKSSLFNWQVWPDFSQLPSPTAPIIQFNIVKETQPFLIHDYQLEAIALSHTVASYAYLIDHNEPPLLFWRYRPY